QAGSDGLVACASCHFSAGADNRTTGTTSPGPNGVFDGPGPGSTLGLADFPFDRSNDDAAGSQGVFGRTFVSVNTGLGSAEDTCTGTTPHRLVTGRNAPTNINAAFNFRNFW